jgi:hypothetical protein
MMIMMIFVDDDDVLTLDGHSALYSADNMSLLTTFLIMLIFIQGRM